jgi:hypothetical protein
MFYEFMRGLYSDSEIDVWEAHTASLRREAVLRHHRVRVGLAVDGPRYPADGDLTFWLLVKNPRLVAEDLRLVVQDLVELRLVAQDLVELRLVAQDLVKLRLVAQDIVKLRLVRHDLFQLRLVAQDLVQLRLVVQDLVELRLVAQDGLLIRNHLAVIHGTDSLPLKFLG